MNKINIFKKNLYIIMMIFLIMFCIYGIFNFFGKNIIIYQSILDYFLQISYVNTYLKNYEDIQFSKKFLINNDEIEKSKKIIDNQLLSDKKNIDKLKNFISNTYLIGQDFENFKKYNDIENIEQLYNYGNYYLIYGFENISQKDEFYVLSGINQLKNSIEIYDVISKNSLSGGKDDLLNTKIEYNKEFALKYLYIGELKYCTIKIGDILSIIIELNNLKKETQEYIMKIIDIIKQKIKQGNIGDQEYECLKKLYKDLNNSLINIESIDEKLNETKQYLQEKINGSIDGNFSCVLNSNISEIKTSINKIQDSINFFHNSYKNFYNLSITNPDYVFENACNSQTSQQNNEMNQLLNEGIENLSNNISPKQNGGETPKQQEGNKGLDENQQKNGQSDNTDDQDNSGKKEEQAEKSSDEKMHNNFELEKYKDLIQNLESQSSKWTEKMNEINSKKGYDPKKYIDQLFESFYGNDVDFKDFENKSNLNY